MAIDLYVKLQLRFGFVTSGFVPMSGPAARTFCHTFSSLFLPLPQKVKD